MIHGRISLPIEVHEKIRSLAAKWHVYQDTPDEPYTTKGIRNLYRLKARKAFEDGCYNDPELEDDDGGDESSSLNSLRCQPVQFRHSVWEEWYQSGWVESDPEDSLQKEVEYFEWSHPDRANERKSLPIFAAKDELLQAASMHQVVLVAAETGSGKSTQVPQYFLDDAIQKGKGSTCHVICTQPRRIAAISLASRVAWERGDDARKGGPVGHVVRFDEQPPRPWGSICYCTDGSLLPRIRRLGASHVIVDEVHTRSIQTDLLLTVLKVLLKYSADLRVIIMSATFDIRKIESYFQGVSTVALVRASGQLHNVNTYFLEDIVHELKWKPEDVKDVRKFDLPNGTWSEHDCNRNFIDNHQKYSAATVNVIRSMEENLIPINLIVSILKWIFSWSKEGSVIIFLPGWMEINACAKCLQRQSHDGFKYCDILRLHSTVTPSEQAQILKPARWGCRNIILSTDIGETSLTIPNVLCVIDSGLAKVKTGATLDVCWASQSNLKQRRGRAGRVRNGVCIHLITQARFNLLQLDPTPEIQRVPLTDVVLFVCDLGLDLLFWNDGEEEYHRQTQGVQNFMLTTPDPPEARFVRDAFQELQHIGALDWQGYITRLGAQLVRFPLPPSHAVAILLGTLLGRPNLAALILSTLDGRDIWVKARPNNKQFADKNDDSALEDRIDHFARKGGRSDSDVFVAAHVLSEFGQRRADDYVQAAKFCKDNLLMLPAMEQMLNAEEQLKRTLLEFTHTCDISTDTETSTDTEQLKACWPLLQSVLLYCGADNLGKHDGGRKVDAGWRRAARLEKTSVLSRADENGKTELVTFIDYANNYGGRMLRGATMVTPQQVLLFGDRRGPRLDNFSAVVCNWLEVPADREAFLSLNALRLVTKNILQEAAKRNKYSGWRADLQEWRAIVLEVVQLPPPAHTCGQRAWMSPAATAWCAPPPPPPAPGLPLGWTLHIDTDSGLELYVSILRGEASAARPASQGLDGNAELWRWRAKGADKEYIRIDIAFAQSHRPDVGAGEILPVGWNGFWSNEHRRHFYCLEDGSGQSQWNFPDTPSTTSRARRWQTTCSENGGMPSAV